MTRPRARRPRAAPPLPWREWSLGTSAGRRSPVLLWRVRNPAGAVCWLSGLQRGVLSYAGAAHAHGRHRWTVRGCARALGCAPSTVTRAIVRLRSLSLLGASRPARGRFGGVQSWEPSGLAAGRDRAERLVRWPTGANVATLNHCVVILSREGLRRSWRSARGGRPPAPRPPGGGPAGAVRLRARGRPWPPAVVTETCPSTGHRTRLPLRSSMGGRPDAALVFGGPCGKCGRAHASAVILAGHPDAGPVLPAPERGRPGATRPALPSPAPTTARSAAAAELLGSVDRRVGDRLRLDYLGWRRQPLHEPVLPAVATGDRDGLGGLVSDLEGRCRRELELVRRSRAVLPPGP